MLNENSQRILCQIILRYIEGENRVEILRRCLCENYDFSPRVLFRSLCRVYCDSLLPKDFKDFLQTNGEQATDQETYLLVRQYSSLQNGRMSEEDFSHFVLSATNETLPLLVSKRLHVQEVKAGVKFSFLALVREEVRLHREIEELKVQLFQDYEFSLWKAFEFLNRDCKGFISEDDVGRFLQSKGKFISQNDFDALMRRIDLEDDLVLSYNEFLEAFIPLQVPKTKSAFLSKSAERESRENIQRTDIHNSPGPKTINPKTPHLEPSPKVQSYSSREEEKTEPRPSSKQKEESLSEDRPLQAQDLYEKQSENSEKPENPEKSEDFHQSKEDSEEENIETQQKVPNEFTDDQEVPDDEQDSQKRVESEEYSEQLDQENFESEENEFEADHSSRDQREKSGSEDES